MATMRQVNSKGLMGQSGLGEVNANPGFGAQQKANSISSTFGMQPSQATPQLLPGIMPIGPINGPVEHGSEGQTPSERGQIPGAGGGAPRAGAQSPSSLASSLQGLMGGQAGVGSQATPTTSMTPTTQGSGSSFQAGGPGSPSGYNPGQMVTPQAGGGLFGGMGGLKGGGLGVPFQPGNPALSNPISLLMNLLQNGLK